jgi:hypothetical protein
MNRKKRRITKRHGFSKKLVYGLIGFLLILLMHLALSSFFYESNDGVSQFSGFKAAIVDHLSLTRPNQTFIEAATNILKQAGFTVDYYPGEKVTVEFYRNLPTHGYSLIILRVHSTPLSLFTSEPYDQNKYVWEQLTDQLTRAKYFQEDEHAFFGVTAQFVRSSMKGRFNNSTIIMMGCLGLTFTDTAEAFIERGAKTYISWNDFVLASHTDLATVHLLRHLITEQQTVRKAVDDTMAEVGPDPIYNSQLLYYPLRAGRYTIQIIARNAAKSHLFGRFKQYKFPFDYYM